MADCDPMYRGELCKVGGTVSSAAPAPAGNMVGISRLYHAALTLAAYASSSALLRSHARLATGCWLGIIGRESNPLNSDERFQSVTPNFLQTWRTASRKQMDP